MNWEDVVKYFQKPDDTKEDQQPVEPAKPAGSLFDDYQIPSMTSDIPKTTVDWKDASNALGLTPSNIPAIPMTQFGSQPQQISPSISDIQQPVDTDLDSNEESDMPIKSGGIGLLPKNIVSGIQSSSVNKLPERDESTDKLMDLLKKSSQAGAGSDIISSFMKLGEKIGSGLAGQKADYTLSSDIAKQAESVKGLGNQALSEQKTIAALKKENDLNDPNSTASIRASKIMQSFGLLKPGQNLTASEIKEFTPTIEKLLSARTAKEQVMGLKDIQRQQKIYDGIEKERIDLDKQLDRTMGSARNAFGRELNRMNDSDHLNALFTPYEKSGKIPLFVLKEAGNTINRMVTGGQGSEHDRRQFEVNTLDTMAKQLEQKIKGDPAFVDAGPWMKEYLEIANRQKDVARNIISRGFESVKSAHPTLFQGHREQSQEEKLATKQQSEEYLVNKLRAFGLTQPTVNINDTSAMSGSMGSPAVAPNFPLQVYSKDGKIATVQNEAQLRNAISKGFSPR